METGELHARAHRAVMLPQALLLIFDHSRVRLRGSNAIFRPLVAPLSGTARRTWLGLGLGLGLGLA